MRTVGVLALAWLTMHRIRKVLAWAPAGEGFRRLALLVGIAGVLFWTASVVENTTKLAPTSRYRVAARGWTRDLPLERLAWTLGCAKPHQTALERELGRPITPGDTAAIDALEFLRGDTTAFRRRLLAISGVDYECRQVPFLLGRATFWLLWLPLAFLLPWGVLQMMLWVIKWVAAGFRS